MSIATLHQDSARSLERIRAAANRDSRIVFVSGNFNILHPGHLRLLRFAKESGDFLVVAVTSDEFPDTMLPERMRLEAVQETSWVDHAFILRDKPEAFIESLKPHVVVKGREHEERYNPELETVKGYGGRLLFCSGDIGFASMDLLRTQIKEITTACIHLPSHYLERHGSHKQHLEDILQGMSGIKVCVIGDTVVDEYIDCEPLGMSQEDPTIVVSPLLRERFVGGAAIVAAHAQSLGGDVSFFSVLGKDEPADFIRSRLAEQGVNACFFSEDDRPTTLKQRFRALDKTLLRVNHLRQHAISHDTIEKLLSTLKPTLEQADLLIFSDFNYGALPQPLVEELIRFCHQRDIAMVADSQCSSQIGDIGRFHGMTLITPTEREARIALKDHDSGLAVLAQTLCAKASAQYMILKLGAEGALIYSPALLETGLHTDQLPAFNAYPKDVAGAGDSLLTTSAMALQAGASIWEAGFLGSLAAACQVSRTGNIPLTIDDLKRGLHHEYR